MLEKFLMLRGLKNGGGGSGGGGSSEDVRYVTFKSYDGTVEYGKKAVAVGDDCADPIARGIFDTPTRESDVQYNYTFYGWATEPNGGAVSDWNKAITEDKTVYANFSASVRYYTITYYDSDGTTVLKTESLAYGATPSYSPTKENYMFGGWSPEVQIVTGDAIYSAVWEEKITFASGSWSKIAEVCAAGNAADTFAVGDTKPITLTYEDGTSETTSVTIVDMGVDIKEDGSYAPLTIMFNNIANPSEDVNLSTGIPYSSAKVIAFFEKILGALPEDLQNVITSVKKDTTYNTYAKIFIASLENLTGETTAKNRYNHIPKAQYAHFANGNTIKRTRVSDTSDDWYVTSSTATTANYYWAIDGESKATTYANLTTKAMSIVPCFCI